MTNPIIKRMLVLFLLLGSISNALNLNTNKEVFSENEKITVTFNGVLNRHKDWVAIYPATSSTAWKNVISWKWTENLKDGTLTFDKLPAGEYEVRLFFNNSYKAEIRKKFTVTTTTHSTGVHTDQESYLVGETITAIFDNMSEGEKDWIAIYPKNSTNEWKNVIQWEWIKGIKSGSQTFQPLSKGLYEVRVFFNNSYVTEASYEFSVIEADLQTEVTTTKNNYTPSENIIANFKNMSKNPKDWIAIYPKGSTTAWKNVIQWEWIQNKKSGSQTFNALKAGEYEVRVFFNNTYNAEASYPFTVGVNFSNVDRKDFQLFGDPELGRIVGMQLSTMKQVFDFPLDGKIIYSSDIINDNKSYGYGRGSNKIFILTKDKQGLFSEQGVITLPFFPRTGAKNKKLGLTLITGSDKPMYAIINTNTDKVVATGGRNMVTQFDNSNHGSHWATGHGVWLTDNHFVVPDREARDLILYEIDSNTLKVTELNRIHTSSSVHTIIGGLNNTQGIYYAVTEGADTAKPSLVKFKFNGKAIRIRKVVKMHGSNPPAMTAHHAKPLADDVHIYMGTSDGLLNIINKKTMKVVKTIPTGKGTGHTTLIPKHNLALIVNHHDTFVTVIDTRTHTKIKDVPVSGESIKNTALQSHTPRVSPDGNYYYNFATDNGYYFRINLLTLTMDKKTYTGGTPKQASQPGEVN